MLYKNRTVPLLLTLSVIGIVIVSCTKKPPEILVTELSIYPPIINLTSGDDYQLQLTTVPEDASESVLWSSKDPLKVSVSDFGVISALHEGETTITATTKGSRKIAECHVLVSSPFSTPENVIISDKQVTLKLGETYILSASITPEQTDDANLIWYSSNPTIASVDNGTVSAHHLGETDIVARTQKLGASTFCHITVVEPIPINSISLKEEFIKMPIGGAFELEYEISPATAHTKNVIWVSSRPEIAKVENGIVTAIAAGFTTIIVSTEDGNKSSSCMVEVTLDDPIPVSDIQILGGPYSIVEGTHVDIKAIILPENASNKTVKWSCSNTQVAYIRGNTLFAVKEGYASISAASFNDIVSATTSITVLPAPKYVEGISLGMVHVDLASGDKYTLTPIFIPSSPDDTRVTWESNNEEVATVENGTVTAHSKGKATVKVTSLDTHNGVFSAICDIEVRDRGNIEDITIIQW